MKYPQAIVKLGVAGQTNTEVVREYLRARIVAWCVVDSEGSLVFHDGDIPALNAKSGAALERVVEVAMRLSGMGDDDVEELAEAMKDNPFGETFSPSPES